ncbi:MAG: transcriptional regulator [Paenibacillus sp.]|nr:transcriptional regulator [Paenibacillus sp.]
MHHYKPIEIARELSISTSALRHYESWGVIPKPARAENGYRLYTKVHLAYFHCLRAMFPGFGVVITCDVLRHIQNADMDTAFWLVNKEQANLQHEKTVADQTLALLQDPELPLFANKKQKNRMTIGEIAALTDVQQSAIRHWEKEGMLSPERDPENGYRINCSSRGASKHREGQKSYGRCACEHSSAQSSSVCRRSSIGRAM